MNLLSYKDHFRTVNEEPLSKEPDHAMRAIACSILSLDENQKVLRQYGKIYTMRDGFIISATQSEYSFISITIEEMFMDGEKSSFDLYFPKKQ